MLVLRLRVAGEVRGRSDGRLLAEVGGERGLGVGGVGGGRLGVGFGGGSVGVSARLRA